MSPSGGARTERLFALSGCVFLVLLGAGMMLCARLIPPPAPEATAEQVTAMFASNLFGTRLGLQLVMVGAPFILPFAVLISRRIRQLEGGAELWAPLQLACGVAGMFIFILPTTILQAAVFRIGSVDPALLRTLDDFAWILFVSTASVFCLQTTAIGLAVLGARGNQVFPRWLGYFNLWVALVSALGVTVPFFKSGPLAWDGLFTYWVALAAFGSFLIVMTVMLVRSIDPAPAPSPVPVH